MPEVEADGTVGGEEISRHAVNAISFAVVPIVRPLIAYKERDKKTARHGQRQAGNVDEGRQLVAEDGAKGYFEVVLDHIGLG